MVSSFEYSIDHVKWESLVLKTPKEYETVKNYEKACKDIVSFIDTVLTKVKHKRHNQTPAYYRVNFLLHIKSSFEGDEQYSCGQEHFITNIEDDNFYPIIHFCKFDLTEEPICNKRYSNVMDNSIWNYFVKYEYKKDGNIEIDINRLLYVLDEIANNTELGLYNLTVTREFAELNARLVEQSYLKGGHGLFVAPFIFHSERIIQELIEKEFENVLIADKLSTVRRIRNQKWRFLLVEDKAVDPMTPVFKNNKEITKTKIIIHLLKDQIEKCGIKTNIIFRKYDELGSIIDNNTDILIEYAETVNEAKEALKSKEYDIILLDYLLNKDGKKENVHYGYELLNDIDDEYKKNNGKTLYKIGPHNRFFFIFISAYSSAVYERLLAEGLNRSEKYWNIAVGACPTNTPRLFLYNLLKLMEKQLVDSGVNKLSAKGICDVVCDIYDGTNGEDYDKSVRYRANKHYQKVLDMHYLYRKMLKDVQFPQGNKNSIFDTEGSVLITNFISKDINLGGLLEHLTQLVHLTAFGTVRQWPEMWEEYIYFKSQFDLKQFEKEIGENADSLFYELCVKIESYILKLKSDIE